MSDNIDNIEESNESKRGDYRNELKGDSTGQRSQED